MGNIWKWVVIISAFILVIAIALIGVAYVTGGSVQRVMETTDIMDMTKFLSRDVLEAYVTRAVDIINRIL